MPAPRNWSLLLEVAGSEGGIYATHMRSEGDGMDSALEETFRIAREASIPVEIWHLKIAGKSNWDECLRSCQKSMLPVSKALISAQYLRVHRLV
jgi:N-acyl-D-aspartate/D-glutamate deacylase